MLLAGRSNGAGMTNPRVVFCEACGSEGRIYRRGWVYESGCSHAHVGEVDDGECPVCQGRGEVEIETQPVDLADLEIIGGAP